MLLDALPPDILLQVVASLSLRDALSLSLANKSLQALSQEHGFWLDPLRATWPSQPLPCPSAEDLTVRTADSLKQLALHTLRLTRNWREAFPRVVGPTWIHKCGQHNDILYCVPGTDLIVMYSLREGTAICCDVITGFASYPVYIGRIVDTSSPIEEQGSFTVALLVGLRDNARLIILKTEYHPISLTIVLELQLDTIYNYSSVFMNSTVVGVARTSVHDFGVSIQSFNILNPTLSTVADTDYPESDVYGSTVLGETIYFVMPAFSDAFVYAFPQRILPCSSETQAEKDYTVRRSHIARLPPLALDPEVTNRVSRLPYCVLSSEPYRGRSTISVARTRIGNINDSRPYSVEITFWPRPSPGSRSSFASDTEYEEAESKKLLPACTIAIPGSIRSRPGVWELIVMANSGLAVIMVVDPPYELPPIIIEDDTEGTEPTEEAPPPPPPQLMLVRFDPLLGSATLHELVLEGATGEDTIDVKNICGVAIDDHRGVAIVVTDDQVLHYIPYA